MVHLLEFYFSIFLCLVTRLVICLVIYDSFMTTSCYDVISISIFIL